MLDYVLDGTRLVRTRTPGTDVPDVRVRLHFHWTAPPNFDEQQDVVEAQPFFAHFVHQAAARAGRSVLPLIRRWKPLVERGNGCVEEYWDAPPGTGSRCHAWSATPTYDLTTHVLGVQFTAPGCTEVRVRPNLGDLTWAEGAVPTPLGFVTVRAEAGKKAEVTLPPGCEAV